MLPQRWQPLLQLIDSRVREFLREPEVIFWVYGFPLLLAVGLGYGLSNKETEPPRVDVQQSPDRARAEAVVKQLTNDNLGKEKLQVQLLPAEECADRLVKGRTDLYLIVHAGEIEYVYDRKIDDAVKARYWVEAILSRQHTGAVLRSKDDDEQGGKYIYFLLPGLIGTNIMGGGLFGVGYVLVDMRVRKLFKRLMATPMRHSDFLLSLLLSRLVFLMPEMTILLLAGHYLLGVPIDGSVFTLLVVILAGSAAFAGIGLLLGSRTEKLESMSGMVNLIMVPQYIFSGVFFSSKRFPEAAQPFIQAMPLTQLNDALREVMLEGKGLLDVSWRLAILLAYAAVCFALALRFFKWR
jgi:ABC-type multidrug transport system permease subunit